jgi:hypothetical protein
MRLVSIDGCSFRFGRTSMLCPGFAIFQVWPATTNDGHASSSARSPRNPVGAHGGNLALGLPRTPAVLDACLTINPMKAFFWSAVVNGVAPHHSDHSAGRQ